MATASKATIVVGCPGAGPTCFTITLFASWQLLGERCDSARACFRRLGDQGEGSLVVSDGPDDAGQLVGDGDRGFVVRDDSIHSSDANPIFVMGALYVLGAAFVYGMSSLLTRGAIDGHRVPLGAVAAGAMLGLLAGLVLVRFEPISGALILAVAGGFSGTVIRQRGVSSGNERE